jgi:GT2 family glycosyltransferase
VSIVITCYNQGRFLSAAIESAQTQTRPADEITVVDDGSTDETQEVIRRIEGIQSVRQTNRGLSAARNLGLRSSSGSLLIFLDADDTLEPTAVEAGLRALAEHPTSAFVFGRFFRSTDRGRWQDPVSARPWPQDAYPGLLHRNFIGMHAVVMYRRDVLERVGGFDESLRACEDYDLYLRVARDFPIHGHEAIVAIYRQHADNLSHDAALMLHSVLSVLHRQKSHAAQDPVARAALRAGVKSWKGYYGKPLVHQAAMHLRQPGRRLRGVGEILTLLRHGRDCLFSEHFNAFRVIARGCMAFIPVRLRGRILHRWPSIDYKPRPGSVHLGDLKRTTPISRTFGFDRGRPVDRYYIESFLESNADCIRGSVLEIGDPNYTRRFGGQAVRSSDVLNVRPGVPQTTIVADLADGRGIPKRGFDCIVATQTLHLIFDAASALRTLHDALRPAGTLLLTIPGTISPLASDQWREHWQWGFTAVSISRLIGEAFGNAEARISVFGNVLASVAFLHGIAAEELSPADLDYRDEHYPVLIAVRVSRSTDQ